MIYIANGGQKQKRLQVEDFMPKLVRHQTGDDIAAAFESWAEAAQQGQGMQ